jgi:CelD/BcsL family acetyltransferase involved in cellulose biosynthesis
MNGRCVGYVSGCDLTHPLARYSPGKVLSSLCIRDAITSGGVEFDFLGGAEKYKRELGGQETVFSRAVIHEAGLRSLKPLLFLFLLNLHDKADQVRCRYTRRKKKQGITLSG